MVFLEQLIKEFIWIISYLNKINFYSQYYFQKGFNDITTKDFKTIAKVYVVLPEDGLRLYNAFLKQYLNKMKTN